MSDSPGTYYVTTALVLVVLPGALALYDPATGLTLLLLCAAMLYLLALAILGMCFWCRWKYGDWPLFTFTSSSTGAPRVTWADAFRQRRIGRRGRG